MPDEDLRTALEITPHFYRAALDFRQWREVLARLAEVFDAVIAQVNIADGERMVPLATADFGMTDAQRRRWMALESHAHDPRIPRALGLPNRPLPDRMLLPEADWHASRYYRELLEPEGVDSALAVHTALEEERLVAVPGLIGRVDQPPSARSRPRGCSSTCRISARRCAWPGCCAGSTTGSASSPGCWTGCAPRWW